MNCCQEVVVLLNHMLCNRSFDNIVCACLLQL